MLYVVLRHLSSRNGSSNCLLGNSPTCNNHTSAYHNLVSNYHNYANLFINYVVPETKEEEIMPAASSETYAEFLPLSGKMAEPG